MPRAGKARISNITPGLKYNALLFYSFDLLTRSITILKCPSAFETRAVVVATVKTTKHAKSDVDPSVAASLATKPNKVMPSRRPTNGFATLLILFRVSELRRQ